MGSMFSMFSRRRAALLAVLLPACSSTSTAEFWVQTINTEQHEIPCLVLVNRQVVMNDRNEPVLSPCPVRIPFTGNRDGTGFDGVELGVKPALVEQGPSGRLVKEFGEGEEPPYMGREYRILFPSDPKRQLFVLVPNPAYRPQ